MVTLPALTGFDSDMKIVDKDSMDTPEMNEQVEMLTGGDKKKATPEKEKWSNHLDYILTMVGYCVSFANLLRFPYICNKNGGGAFLIPFLLFLLLAAVPLFILESSMSQFSGKGNLHVWSYCPLFKGVGLAAVIQACMYFPYLQILLAYPFYYMYKSCSKSLPWATCGNPWNTDLCVEGVTDANKSLLQLSFVNGSLTVEMDVYANTSIAEFWRNTTLSHTAVEEFWQYNTLGITSGIEEVGGVQWHLVLCLFASYTVVFASLFKGVKSVGKVVYVTATVPYILLAAIFIRSLTQEGAIHGIVHYVTPDLSRLLNIQVWLEACLQVFYSVGCGFGFISTASSYNKFHDPCIRVPFTGRILDVVIDSCVLTATIYYRDSLVICIISEVTSIVAGFVTFSTLGVMSAKTGVPISQVASSGPGLAYIAYPEALLQLPLPQLWSFLFFFMLILVGLDSQFMNAEVISTSIMDQFPRRLHGKRWLVTLVICLLSFPIGIIFCTQGGMYIFQLCDWYVCSIVFFVVGTVECVCAAWIYGITQINEDFKMMFGRSVPLLLKISWCYVIPLLLIVVFIATMLRYQPPTYGKYHYPGYVGVIGWIMGTIPLIAVLVCAVREVLRQKYGPSLIDKIKLSLEPDHKWRPNAHEFTREHKIMLENRGGWRDNFMDSLPCFKQKNNGLGTDF